MTSNKKSVSCLLAGLLAIAAVTVFFVAHRSSPSPAIAPAPADPILQTVTTQDHAKAVADLKKQLAVEQDPARQNRLRQALVAVAGPEDVPELRSLPQGEQIARDVIRKEQTRRKIVGLSKTDAAETLRDRNQPLAVKLAALEKLKGADPETAIPILSETARNNPDAAVRTTALQILTSLEKKGK